MSLGLLRSAILQCGFVASCVYFTLPNRSNFSNPKHSNVDELIANLNELRSLMCGGASLARTSAQRKVGDFRSDPKADAALVDAWTETEKQLNGEVPNFTVLICALILPRSDKYCCCLPFNKDVLVKCKIGAYKTRALVNVATKERYKP